MEDEELDMSEVLFHARFIVTHSPFEKDGYTIKPGMAKYAGWHHVPHELIRTPHWLLMTMHHKLEKMACKKTARIDCTPPPPHPSPHSDKFVGILDTSLRNLSPNSERSNLRWFFKVDVPEAQDMNSAPPSKPSRRQPREPHKKSGK
jgi:hypothetical protein